MRFKRSYLLSICLVLLLACTNALPGMAEYGIAGNKDDGASLYAWGSNDSGQLGKGTIGGVGLSPAKVSFGNQVGDVLAIAAGRAHSVAIVRHGNGNGDGAIKLYTWGSNSAGQTAQSGSASGTPSMVEGLNKLDKVWAGGDYSFIKDKDTLVYAWGNNSNGELTGADAHRKGLIAALNKAQHVAAGSGHIVAMLTNNYVSTAGSNSNGQRGITPYPPGYFTQIYADGSDYTGFTNIAAVAAGGNFTLALQQNGTLWGWGDNTRGQLTVGSEKQETPRKMEALSNVMTMAAGSNHTLAITKNQKVYAWGDNTYGQLGRGTAGGNSTTPVEITGLANKNIIAVGAGDGFSVALSADGDVYTWGRNDKGQLGLGHTQTAKAPTKVSGLSGVEEIAVGGSHVLARGGTYSGGGNVAVTGVSLNKTKLELPVGTAEQLIATVLPASATDKSVTWTTSNPGVATVDGNGNVTAVAPGTATITVKTADGGYTATCLVNVVEKMTQFKVYLTPTGGNPVANTDQWFNQPVYVELTFPAGVAQTYTIDENPMPYTGNRIVISKKNVTTIGYQQNANDQSLTFKKIKISYNEKFIVQPKGNEGVVHLDLRVSRAGKNLVGVKYVIKQADSNYDFTIVKASGDLKSVGDDEYKATADAGNQPGYYQVAILLVEEHVTVDENGVSHTKQTETQMKADVFMVDPGFRLAVSKPLVNAQYDPARRQYVSNQPITISLVKDERTSFYFTSDLAKPSPKQKLKMGSLFDRNENGSLDDEVDWDWDVVQIEYAIIKANTAAKPQISDSDWRPLKSKQIVITSPNEEWRVGLRITDNYNRWNSDSPGVSNEETTWWDDVTYKVVPNLKKY